jgi:hypothetical protein
MSVLPKEPNSEPRVRADRDRPGSAEQLAPRERGFFYADCDGAGVRARSVKKDGLRSEAVPSSFYQFDQTLMTATIL